VVSFTSPELMEVLTGLWLAEFVAVE